MSAIEQELIRSSIELGTVAAASACLQIVCAVKEGRGAEGLLAHALKPLVNENDGLSRDNVVEGFCDHLQKFIEAWVNNDGLTLEQLSESRLAP